MKSLDSGFLRNDGEEASMIFYETIIFLLWNILAGPRDVNAKNPWHGLKSGPASPVERLMQATNQK
jgi:hypothetical protein